MTRLHKSMKCAIIFWLSSGFHLFVYSGAANRFRLADAPFCVQQLREAQSDPLPQFQQLIIEHPSDDRTTAVFGLSRCFNRQENNRPSTRQLLFFLGASLPNVIGRWPAPRLNRQKVTLSNSNSIRLSSPICLWPIGQLIGHQCQSYCGC